jgi:ubiquinone/menaquinone biosynthesis C-methylase UbiE
MHISGGLTNRTCAEAEILNQVLSFDNKNILELGCGKAEITRVIATEGLDRSITATEVDKIQHQKNLEIDDLPNVKFLYAGSQDLPFEDSSFDIVLLFKSLHHVPMNMMDDALKEITRVLKPGGLVYISEPIFAGEFNDILRLFHDEETVRQAAFDAILKSVDSGDLRLNQQLFFNTQRVYKEFSEFKDLIINVTHNDHSLSAELMSEVETKFMAHMTDAGARFLTPLRVDLLTK